MTETDTPPPAESAAPAPANGKDKDAIASLAGQIKHASPGVVARLRRAHPQQDSRSALFEAEWMLQTAHIHPRSDDERQRWALALHCLAIAQGQDACGTLGNCHFGLGAAHVMLRRRSK